VAKFLSVGGEFVVSSSVGGLSQDGSFKADSLWYSQPMEADQRTGDMVVATNLVKEPCSSTLSRLDWRRCGRSGMAQGEADCGEDVDSIVLFSRLKYTAYTIRVIVI